MSGKGKGDRPGSLRAVTISDWTCKVLELQVGGRPGNCHWDRSLMHLVIFCLQRPGWQGPLPILTRNAELVEANQQKGQEEGGMGALTPSAAADLARQVQENAKLREQLLRPEVNGSASSSGRPADNRS